MSWLEGDSSSSFGLKSRKQILIFSQNINRTENYNDVEASFSATLWPAQELQQHLTCWSRRGRR